MTALPPGTNTLPFRMPAMSNEIKPLSPAGCESSFAATPLVASAPHQEVQPTRLVPFVFSSRSWFLTTCLLNQVPHAAVDWCILLHGSHDKVMLNPVLFEVCSGVTTRYVCPSSMATINDIIPSLQATTLRHILLPPP
eukprot:1674415-Prymnesium_polylepis.1